MNQRPGLDRPFKILALIVTLAIAAALAFANPALAELTAENIATLREQGREEGWTFTVGENSATGYSIEELCGLKMPENWEETVTFKTLNPTTVLPSRFDWRDYTNLPPARNQGSCGSCWAFSTVGALECAIKLKDGIIEDLSEQWLVSCNHHGWGCDGGQYAHEYHRSETDWYGDSGAVYEIDFPYTALDDPCAPPYPHQYWIKDWSYITNSVQSIKQTMLEYGPVCVSVYVNDAFQAYGGGIFNNCEYETINHAVVLVGWDDNQGDEGVWFMRNSWGEGWGEDGGYMRIPYACSRIGYAANHIDYNGEFGPPIISCNEFAFGDDLGDGNGRADPGENDVKLYLTMGNYGTDATGLTVDVSASDPEIIFSATTSDFGDLVRWQEVDNTADPIIFSVDPAFPPTIVEFELTFTWNGGAYSRVETLTVDVGQPQFIIIDDDEANPATYEEYYTHLLDSLRTPHVVWGKDTLLSPSADTLSEYPIAMWFTGDARPDLEVLSADDANNLRGFLDGGGRLLLTGQDIAQDLADDADSTFLRDYLHVRFSPGSPMILAQGVAEDPISDGHTLPLGGPGGAANQTSPDVLVPADPTARVCYNYYNSTDAAGIRVASEDYRVVFLGFGVEAIADGLPGYTKRVEVMAAIFDWLSAVGPDYPPGDLDDDGEVTPIDVAYAVNYVYRQSDPPPNGLNSVDVDGDCGTSPLDVMCLVYYVYQTRGTLLHGCVE